MRAEPLDTATEIETPEHVRFHRRIAGPARRAAAYVLDLLLRGVVVFLFGMLFVLGSAGFEELTMASQGVMMLVFFAIEWGYFVLFEMLTGGRSPGKMALSLRVVSDTGHPLQLTDSVLRNLLRAADLLPMAYALGLIVMGRDRRFRRLGDMVAGTMVVVEEKHSIGEPLRIYPPPSREELAWLPSRVPLSADELDAVELYLRRAERLGPARAIELAEIVAPVYGRRLGLRPADPHRFLQVLYHKARGS